MEQGDGRLGIRCQVSGVRWRRDSARLKLTAIPHSLSSIRDSLGTKSNFQFTIDHLQFIPLLLFLVFFGLAVPALAHAELLSASPAPGESLGQSPAEIRLRFSEPIGSGSDIFVFSERFIYLEGLTTRIEGESELVVALPPLAPNDYTVQWTAVSSDGHSVSGSYSFRVAEGLSFTNRLLPAGITLMIVVTLVGIVLFLRRGKHETSSNRL